MRDMVAAMQIALSDESELLGASDEKERKERTAALCTKLSQKLSRQFLDTPSVRDYVREIHEGGFETSNLGTGLRERSLGSALETAFLK